MNERQCKRDGCLEPAVDKSGMYALLCEFHKNQAKHDRTKSKPDPSSNGNAHLDAAERFLAAARALDQAEHEFRQALEAASRR